VNTYLQAEYALHIPYLCNHIGWNNGMERGAFTIPPEAETDMATMGPDAYTESYGGWRLNPITFYALWKYAQKFGGALAIYNACTPYLEATPSDAYLLAYVQVQNAWIAGLIGYLNLEALAGQPETAAIRTEYNRLLAFRATHFTTTIPANWISDNNYSYFRALSVARNFMYMVPELGTYLHDHILSTIQAAVDEYNYVAPYWLKTKLQLEKVQSNIFMMSRRCSLLKH
jgi:hypothetical protein